MKHIKLYEGFLSDLEVSTKNLEDEFKGKVDYILQSLIDDYGLEFVIYNKADSLFRYDLGDGEKEITPEFVRELQLADRKLRQNGSYITIPPYYYSAVTVKQWYDENSGRGTGMQQISIYSSVEEFAKEMKKYSSISITRLRLEIIDI